MLTINVYYKGEGDNPRKFAEEMLASGVVEQIRKEAGNLKYEYFFPVENKSVVLLVDSWKDQDSLDKHHQSALMNTIISLREKYDLHMTVQRFVSIEDNPQDEKYLRK